jgi:hypothetical protein
LCVALPSSRHWQKRRFFLPSIYTHTHRFPLPLPTLFPLTCMFR